MKNFNPSKFNDSRMEDDSEDEIEFAIDEVNDEVAEIVSPFVLENIIQDDDDGGFDNVDIDDDSDDDFDPQIILEDDSSSDSDKNGENSSDNETDGDTKAETEQADGGGEAGSSSKQTVEKRVIDNYDENEEEDEVIKAIISEIKKPRSKPPDIKTEDFVTDLCFHPDKDILSVATTAGDVLIYKYTNDETTLVETLEVHTKAVRDIEFTQDGKSLISTSRDRTIMISDFETGKLKRFWDDAHDEPVYTMYVIDENLFATGDDDGVLKLWDMRQRDSKAICSLKEVDDFISCILTNDQNKYLLLTSGDGYLTTINIPQRKLYVQSEPYEEELTSMGIFRKDSKLVVSSSKGNFYTFNWLQFGYHCDAFSGPKTGVNKMIPITERIAVTGGEEGVLRAMHLVPGRILGVVGQHSLAVETMDISSNGELIASSSHDNDIRFWNIKYFEEFDDIKYNSRPDKRSVKHNLPSSKHTNFSDFFSGLA
uniref:WD repeat-containing protein 55 homolog n=1 Tax=Corethrella appendiculata TaxID=1370023 RepID=U5EX47_9DIPT